MKIPGQDQPGAPAHGTLLQGGPVPGQAGQVRLGLGDQVRVGARLEAGPDLGLLAFGPGQEGEGQGPERRIHGSAGKRTYIGRTGRRAQGPATPRTH